MKTLVITVLVLFFSCLCLQAEPVKDQTQKAKLFKLKMMIRKLQRNDNSASYSPTAVAGVRGDDVSTQVRLAIMPTDLIWEE